MLLFVGARARAQFPDEGALQRVVAEALGAYNADAGGSSYRTDRARLEFDPLSPADGEITDKGSVNQRKVLERRADAVLRLFAEPSGTDVIRLNGP